MKRVVSVSLGSSKRDKTVLVPMLGEEVELKRVGTDGSIVRARELIAQLDGKVDCFGLGGIDLYLFCGKSRYVVRDALKLASAAKKTPVVDGSGIKNTLERDMMAEIASRDDVGLRGRRILLVSGVDRYGMAEAMAGLTDQIIFGDMIFALGIKMPLRSLKALRTLGYILLPIVTKLPFKILYPTGEKQEESRPRHMEFFDWAEVIAGDFHFIRRNLPERIEGKVVITNTTTEDDQKLLRERGASILITTTPVIEGRSFGANVLEAAIVALLGKEFSLITPNDYRVMLNKLEIKPTILRL